MKLPDKTIVDQAWKIATSIEWTVADWKDFYESLSMFFIRVAGRHAKERLSGREPDSPRSEITGKPQSVRPDSAD